MMGKRETTRKKGSISTLQFQLRSLSAAWLFP
jgi:hypothetical protein